MSDSYIYLFKKSDNKFHFVRYGCCEHLGSHCAKNSDGKRGEMYIHIPMKYINQVFEKNAIEMVSAYLELLSKCFDVEYRIATEEEVEKNILITSEDADGGLYIYANMNKASNKRFVASYTMLRYLWFENGLFSNVASIAANLYKYNIFSDPMSVIAIASSYQVNGGRALLPYATYERGGLIYFRSKDLVLPELQKDQLFNNVFYKYPIYFNPEITIESDFFEGVKKTIDAKNYIVNFSTYSSDEISSTIMKNINSIRDDYELTRDVYIKIVDQIEKSPYPGFTMSKDNPILLSKKNIESGSFVVKGSDAIGYSQTLKININD